MQVDPTEPELKPSGTKRLKLECDELLSTFGFNTNLRRYTEDAFGNIQYYATVYPDDVLSVEVASPGRATITVRPQRYCMPRLRRFPGCLKWRSPILEKQTVDSPYCTIVRQI